MIDRPNTTPILVKIGNFDFQSFALFKCTVVVHTQVYRLFFCGVYAIVRLDSLIFIFPIIRNLDYADYFAKSQLVRLIKVRPYYDLIGRHLAWALAHQVSENEQLHVLLVWKALNECLFLSLEQLERPECSSISDGYTLSIAFACLLEIVKGLDMLVQENNGSSNGGDVGWIEPEVPGTAIETGVGTDTIRAAAKEGVENDKGG